MGKRGPKPGSKRGSAALGASMNLRLSSELRAKLEAAAEREGRELSEEIRLRLRRSFDEPEFMDPQTRDAVALIGLALDWIVRGQENHPWHETKRSFIAAQRAIDIILSWYDPGGTPVVPDDHPALQAIRNAGLGEKTAEDIRQELENSDTGLLAGSLVIAHAVDIAGGKLPPMPYLTAHIASSVKAKLDAAGLSEKTAEEFARASAAVLRPIWGWNAERITDDE